MPAGVVLEPGRAALAVEENLFELFRSMARSLPAGALVEDDRMGRHTAAPANPMFKGVWHTRVDGDDLEDAVDATIAWFEARDAPCFFWWTGPSTAAPGLVPTLEARGLISMAEQTEQLATGIKAEARGSPGMIADLHDVPTETLRQVPVGFRFDPVASEDDLDAFARVFAEAYGVPRVLADGWVEAARHIGLGRTPWRMYLGRLDDEPVATSMAFRGAGVASVYGIATLPEARGQGIGGAVTLAPLLEDRDAGIRFGVLFSSLEGVGAYERVGFRLVDGVWIDRYLWRGPTFAATVA